jgi:hypothetical protein
MENAQTMSWLELYKEAVSEDDPQKLTVRILVAHKAIQERGRQLWYEGSQETGERTRLDAASHSLEALRKLEKKEVRYGSKKPGNFSAVA